MRAHTRYALHLKRQVVFLAYDRQVATENSVPFLSVILIAREPYECQTIVDGDDLGKQSRFISCVSLLRAWTTLSSPPRLPM